MQDIFRLPVCKKNELAYTRTRKFKKINPHGGRLNIKTSSYQYWDPHLKIRRSCDRFIFDMKIPIPEKDGLNIETGPWYWNGNITGDVSQYNGKLCPTACVTVETLYSTIYYSKYFIELNFDKSTQYVALWTQKRHPIPRPFGRAMECLLWVLQQKLTVL